MVLRAGIEERIAPLLVEHLFIVYSEAGPTSHLPSHRVVMTGGIRIKKC